MRSTNLSASLAAILLMTAPAIAHEDGKAPHREKIIIKMTDADAATHDDLDAKCASDASRIETRDAKKGADGKTHEAHVLVCAGGSPQDAIARLEKARDRLSELDQLSEDARTRAVTAIDAEIARLKAAR